MWKVVSLIRSSSSSPVVGGPLLRASAAAAAAAVITSPTAWVLALLLISCCASSVDSHSQPIIAVLTVPVAETTPCVTLLNKFFNGDRAVYDYSDQERTEFKDAPSSCFTSYYAQWIESAGGRVVPLRYDTEPQKIKELLTSVNGVLFTGGEVDLKAGPVNHYMDTATFLYDEVLRINEEEGVYFPLWATCMGIQVLSIVASRNRSVLTSGTFDSEDMSLPLEITRDGLDSHLFANASSELMTVLQRENVTSNLHHDGVTPASFAASNLSLAFSVVSTNRDRKGVEFISTIEHLTSPIYGVQWHPERPQYEFKEGTGINHGPVAIEAMQYFANFFVNEARMNQNVFPGGTVEEEQHLLYNYIPHYKGNSEMVYLFYNNQTREEDSNGRTKEEEGDDEVKCSFRSRWGDERINNVPSVAFQ